jgi:hypothetical protein
MANMRKTVEIGQFTLGMDGFAIGKPGFEEQKPESMD